MNNLQEIKKLAREALEHQLSQPAMEGAMLQFMRQHQGRELEVTLEIRMQPKVAATN